MGEWLRRCRGGDGVVGVDGGDGALATGTEGLADEGAMWKRERGDHAETEAVGQPIGSGDEDAARRLNGGGRAQFALDLVATTLMLMGLLGLYAMLVG